MMSPRASCAVLLVGLACGGCGRQDATPSRVSRGVAPAALTRTAVVLEEERVHATRERALTTLLDAATSDDFRQDAPDGEARNARYAAAAEALLSKPWVSQYREETLAFNLVQIDDPRASQALGTIALRSDIPAGERRWVLHAMRRFPRAEHLPIVRAVLARPDLATERLQSSLGPLAHIYGFVGEGTPHTEALDVAHLIRSPEARDLLRTIALDRTLPSPDPRIVEATRCRGLSIFSKPYREAAYAFASLRLVALSLLEDRALTERIAADATEAPFVRRVARRLLADPKREPAWAAKPFRPSGDVRVCVP
jgi:hypothetical protein